MHISRHTVPISRHISSQGRAVEYLALQQVLTLGPTVQCRIADAPRKFYETEGYEGHSSNVLRTIGYFSLVGLLRVHCLLGEYETALRALGPINPFQTAYLLTPKVAGANIALYYYAGFSYLMLQRYLDATRAFNTVLVYINR